METRSPRRRAKSSGGSPPRCRRRRRRRRVPRAASERSRGRPKARRAPVTSRRFSSTPGETLSPRAASASAGTQLTVAPAQSRARSIRAAVSSCAHGENSRKVFLRRLRAVVRRTAPPSRASRGRFSRPSRVSRSARRSRRSSRSPPATFSPGYARRRARSSEARRRRAEETPREEGRRGSETSRRRDATTRRL